jgi:hypothetical protein
VVIWLELPAGGGGDGEGEEVGLLPPPPCPCAAALVRSLWRLQRKDPGWLVGEHMQDRRLRAPAAAEGDETLTDWPAGGRAPAPAPASLMRDGEAER